MISSILIKNRFSCRSRHEAGAKVELINYWPGMTLAVLFYVVLEKKRVGSKDPHLLSLKS